MRGATKLISHLADRDAISIHAPHAGRDGNGDSVGQRHFISIHAPHAGRDCIDAIAAALTCQFQSTRPMRGATDYADVVRKTLAISIHAPHAGRDASIFLIASSIP